MFLITTSILYFYDDTDWRLIVLHFKGVFCKIVMLNPSSSNTEALV